MMRSFTLACFLLANVSGTENVLPLVIGGEDAVPRRFAYMISLQSVSTLNHFCGGTLIAPDVVLTAAHCIEFESSVENLAVRAQPYRLNDPLEPSEIFPVAKTVVHPQYDRQLLSNDLGLIKLNGTSVNQPLIKINSDPDLPSVGQSLTQMGWGDTTNEFSVFPDILQVLEGSTYIEQSMCRDLLEQLGFVNIGFLTDDMICTQERENEGICQADSGGPLIIQRETLEEDIQVGIVSWGVDCANALSPSGFARVSWNFDFIHRTLCELSDLPPVEFNCTQEYPKSYTPSQEPSISVEPSLTPAPSAVKALVTVQLYLNFNAGGVSWRIEALDGTLLSKVERGTYSDSFQFVTTTISVPAGEVLNFIVIDVSGFGIVDPFGPFDAANIFLGERADVTRILSRVRSSFSGLFVTTSFIVSEENLLPTLATNVPTVSPSLSLLPSRDDSTENSVTIDVTLVINFDTYPIDTSWEIVRAKTLVRAAFGGPYNPFVGRNITNTITLIANEAYRLSLRDNRGNGICCEDGAGSVFLYLGAGPRNDRVLVYDDGRFASFSTHTFTTSIDNTFVYTLAPSASPSTSQLPTLSMEPTGPAFQVTVTIFLDSSSSDETSWAILGSTGVVVSTGRPTESKSNLLEETVQLELGNEYTFEIYDTAGNGLCCGRYGVVSAGAFYSRDSILAYVSGAFRFVRRAKFLAAPRGILDFTLPPQQVISPSPTRTLQPSARATNSPSLVPSTTAIPSSSLQTNITLQLNLFTFREGISVSIDTTDSKRRVVQRTAFESLASDPWLETFSVDLGRRYLFTISDREGKGAADVAVVYLGSEIDISRTIMTMKGTFGYVRKQYFVASEEGLLGFTPLPTSVPSTSPSLEPSASSKPSFWPTLTTSPSTSQAPTGSPMYLQILIQFDSNPFETGWKLVDVNGETVVEQPPQSYKTGMQFAIETLQVENEGEYTIVFEDSSRDGMCCFPRRGQAFVFLGSASNRERVLVYEDGRFQSVREHTFVVSFDYVLPIERVPPIPRIPTQMPTLSQSPSFSATSTTPVLSTVPSSSETFSNSEPIVASSSPSTATSTLPSMPQAFPNSGSFSLDMSVSVQVVLTVLGMRLFIK